MENTNHKDICDLRIEMSRIDERLKAADKALELARGQVSRAALISVVTIIIAILALAIQLIKR